MSDYKTGYKKPPKHSQFKKGESGNNKGRPKNKPISIFHYLEKLLRKKITVKDNGSIRTTIMSKSQKKTLVINKKSPITKTAKRADIASARAAKPDKAEPKILTGKSEKPAGDSKQAKVLALLNNPGGATIDEMAKATGWQRHSIQGMMSGVLKKKLGLTVTSDKEERGRVYRLTGSVSRL